MRIFLTTLLSVSVIAVVSSATAQTTVTKSAPEADNYTYFMDADDLAGGGLGPIGGEFPGRILDDGRAGEQPSGTCIC